MWTYKLEYYNIKWAEFREPDIGNQMTAIACVTDNSNIFSKLRLFGEEKKN